MRRSQRFIAAEKTEDASKTVRVPSFDWPALISHDHSKLPPPHKPGVVIRGGVAPLREGRAPYGPETAYNAHKAAAEAAAGFALPTAASEAVKAPRPSVPPSLDAVSQALFIGS